MPKPEQDHISVCICTFQRPELLKRLLGELSLLSTDGMFCYSIVVSDNDGAQSARQLVGDFAARSRIPVTYCCEPRQNIALARNNALNNAQGNYIAFIDDDESPTPNWLLDLLQTCKTNGADGVLGPVVSRFEQEPPQWLIKGGFLNRPEHPTGFKIGLSDMRTGNVLFRREILDGMEAPFRTEFGAGGEDVDFFHRMTGQGRVFLWCNESVVYETVPPERFKRGYLLKRAFRRGNNMYKLPFGRARGVSKALVALPVYGLALPFLLFTGQHRFMKYLVKFCDHAGLLLGFAGVTPFDKYR